MLVTIQIALPTSTYMHTGKFIVPKYTKRAENCLDIPHTMELVEAMNLLELLMHTDRFP